jgi:hypothetical protein
VVERRCDKRMLVAQYNMLVSAAQLLRARKASLIHIFDNKIELFDKKEDKL